MTNLVLAITVFLVSHLIPSIPGLRDTILSHVGRRFYFGAYGTLSTVTLIWVLAAAIQAPVVLVWTPAGWQAWMTLILSPIGLFLIVAGAISVNPLSLSARPGRDRESGAIVAITRHPVFWGAAIWAGSHIPPNGDTRSIILFGALALLAISGFWLGDRRAQRALGADWPHLAAGTSILPFAAILAGRARLRADAPMGVALVVSAALTVWLLWGGHAQVFGADPLAAAA